MHAKAYMYKFGTTKTKARKTPFRPPKIHAACAHTMLLHTLASPTIPMQAYCLLCPKALSTPSQSKQGTGNGSRP